MVKRLTQADVKGLYNGLQSKSNEKDVENAWRDIFKKYFVDKNPDGNASMSSPCKVDGFIFEDRIVFALRILLEFKDGTDLQKVYDRARITIQCIYYMKQFADKGIQLPNVIVGADENQAFVLYAPNFYKYLQDDSIDWSIAPSKAYKSNPDMMSTLVNDSNLSVFVYDLNAGLRNIKQRYATIKNLFDEVNSLGDFDPNTGKEFKVNVTESNLAVLFDEFVRITFKSLRESDKVSPVDMVNIFQQLLLGRNQDEYYQLPSDPNKLHLPGDKKVAINGSDMNAFFKHFNRNLSIKEQDSLISISDRLIEDLTRRRKGDYWTPTIWANKAISLLDEQLNGRWKTKQLGLINDWKKDCVVWDCASGAKNLTRDFQFNHLYSSTIHQGELDLSSQYNLYPKTNKAFQYDFLNDDVEQLNLLKKSELSKLSSEQIKAIKSKLKMPEDLFDNLLANKPIVFYINPPFGTANSRSFAKNNAHKKRNMAKTEIRALMQENKMGKATQQLYAQFFYRITELVNTFHLTNVILAAFSPYQFRVGGDYFGKFYKHFLDTLHPFTGFLFNAGEFSDVNDDWAITFSLYSNESLFTYSEDVEVCQFKQGNIKSLFTKTIRTIDKRNSLSTWIKSYQSLNTNDKLRGYDHAFSAVTSAVKAVPPRDKSIYYKNAIGYMYYIGNDVEHSDTAVSLFSSLFKSEHGIIIDSSNMVPSIIGFAIRRSADFNWFNGKDGFYIDSKIGNSILRNKTFIGDCTIFSLAQYRSSYQSSLGSNSVPDNYPEIDNEWFFLPVDVLSELFASIKASVETRTLFSAEYGRIKSSSDSAIVNLLKSLGVSYSLSVDRIVIPHFAQDCPLSQAARNMLKVIVSLFNKTWKYRELAIQGHPDWSLERFDAGFNQLYKVLTQVINDNEWVEDYKKAYQELRKNIHSNSIALGIMPKDA